MGPFGVVEGDPVTDDPFGFKAVGQLVQVDCLVFERAPQAFDKDIVHAPTPPIHGDRNLRPLENAGEVEAGKLTTLVGVENLRFAYLDNTSFRASTQNRTSGYRAKAD